MRVLTVAMSFILEQESMYPSDLVWGSHNVAAEVACLADSSISKKTYISIGA